MRRLRWAPVALLVGCGGSTIYLEAPRDAAVAEMARVDAPGPDVPTDAARGADGGCLREAGTQGGCPADAVPHARDTAPAFRVAQIYVASPVGFATPLLQNVLNESIRAGGLRWGVSFDLTSRRARTGTLEIVSRGTVGLGLLDGRYRFFETGEWSAGEGPLTEGGDRVVQAQIRGPVRIPVRGADGALVATIPLRCIRFANVSLTQGRCLGVVRPLPDGFDECRSRWVDTERVDATITVDDARTVQGVGPGSLCDLLAGGDCSGSPSAWARPPDDTCDTAAGYRFVAQFAAVSANIE